MKSNEPDYIRASQIIAKCERDLRRILSHGEQRDLLADNSEWSGERIFAIVEALNMTWGVGAFSLAEARRG